MKSKWGMLVLVLLVIGFVFWGFQIFQQESDTQMAANHSAKLLTLKEMPRNVETEIQFIKERIEQEAKEEAERLRLEEEKRKEAERLRIEEEKQKEAERQRVEEEKRIAEQKAKEEQQSQENENKEKQAEPNPPAEPTEEKPSSSSYGGISSFEKDVVSYTNVERVKNGLSELQIDHKLSEVAWYKSQDMQRLGYFDHTSPTYGSPFDMMLDFGVQYTAAGENIAYGYPTAESLVQAWMDSPGHRANILSESFTHIGVGYVQEGHYATQMFIRK